MKALSPKEQVVLELLASGRERFGLELVDASNGDLKRGTVYVTLGRMEASGLVESRLEAQPREGDRPGGLPRRLYKASAIGLRALELAREHQRVMATRFAIEEKVR